ncbi:MAG: hypothetical protein K2Y18_10495 [Alphaproteobacteria bacterium]|jgi:hypothetical protein|nr:hypothetical protein [Alphaproteobacteria bacterium]
MFKALLFFFTLSIFLIGSLFWYVSKLPPKELIPSQFVNSHLKDYSKEEQSLIQDDLKNISDLCFRDCTRIYSTPIYVGTAGGPGSSKSTILETYLHDKTNYVYADPDQRALKFMINTYISSCNNYAIANAASFKELIKGAYEKWRAASNYIACSILNKAFAGDYNIAHGTTSTAKQITGLYEKLKAEHYKIILLLCGTTDQNRVNAIRARGASQDFVQNSDEDTIQKGKAFPERFPDYFKYGDEIHLYWTETFSKGSILAAIYDTKTKSLSIKNQAAFESFVKQYPTIVAYLPKV